MEILPIGSVVILNKGEQELMITSRFPLYPLDGEMGYFEYAGCIYPHGYVKQENYFFNSEDIEKVQFIGYESEEEEELREKIISQIQDIKYRKLSVHDI